MSSQNSHNDLFGGAPAPTPEKAPAPGYSAAHIEVLEGLEAVRRRPGMYIGGTDERAFHHLFAEILDNSMDEAVAGWADRIEVVVDEDGFITVTDNGRGIPGRSAPEISRQVRAGSRADRAARRRQVLRQCLQDLRRPARRGYLGGQRAVGNRRDRGRPRKDAVATVLFARPAAGPDREGRSRPQPPRHEDPFPARSGDFRREDAGQAGARLCHGTLQGLPAPRCEDPVALCAVSRRGHRDPGRRHSVLPGRPGRPDDRNGGQERTDHGGDLLRQGRARGWRRRRGMGRYLVRQWLWQRGRRLLPVLTAIPCRRPRAARTNRACARH